MLGIKRFPSRCTNKGGDNSGQKFKTKVMTSAWDLDVFKLLSALSWDQKIKIQWPFLVLLPMLITKGLLRQRGSLAEKAILYEEMYYSLLLILSSFT